jgi:hypothetical protein
MALHGELKVNGFIIAFWSAQRLDDLADVDQVSLYHCVYEEVSPVTGDAWHSDAHLEAALEHRYSDGAAVLAKKVLTLAEGGW